MIRCLDKEFGIATTQCYKKRDSIAYQIMYETDKIPYQRQVNEPDKKRRDFFWVH